MPVNTAVIIGIIVALAATVLCFIFILPDDVRNRLPGFFRFVHDLFNFKTLMIEQVMKVLYVFCTIGSICIGILLLFSSIWWAGLIVLVIGPLVLRVFYELIMLGVLLVQNVISINRKLKK